MHGNQWLDATGGIDVAAEGRRGNQGCKHGTNLQVESRYYLYYKLHGNTARRFI